MKVWLLDNNNCLPLNNRQNHFIDERELDAFVSTHASGNIFQTFSMYRLYQCVNEYKPSYMTVVDEHGNIQGLMLSCIISEKGLTNKFSARSIITGGPLVKENNKKVTELLIEGYLNEIKNKAIYSQCRNIYLRDHLKDSFVTKGFDYHDHYTIVVDLTKTEEELFTSVHKKKRNNIRRAHKRGVEFRKLFDRHEQDTAINLIQATYKRVKVPGPPRSLLENAVLYFPENVHFFGVFFNCEMVAAKISLSYNSMVYDWYSGHNVMYSYLCAGDVLSWNTLVWAKQLGFEVYDLGGAGKPGIRSGVREFKMRFGGQLHNTGRYMQVHKSLMYAAGFSFIHLRSKLLS